MATRMQFSIRGMLLLILFLGLGVAGVRLAYLRVLIPSKPIKWAFHDVDSISKMGLDVNRIIIVSANWDPITSFSFVRAAVESPQFRTMVYRHRIKCWCCDITNNFGPDAARLEKVTGVPIVSLPVVVAVKDGEIQVLKLSNDFTFESLCASLESIFETE